MVHLKTGNDLKIFASSLGLNLIALAAALGYKSDFHIKRIVRNDDAITRRVYLSCLGLHATRMEFGDLIELEFGEDLAWFATSLGVSVLDFSRALGYCGDTQINKMIARNEKLSKNVKLMCTGLGAEEAHYT